MERSLLQIAGLQCNVSVSTPEQRYVQGDIERTREDLTQGYVRFPTIIEALRRIAQESKA